MSRRDEAIESLDSTLSSLRVSIASALAPRTDPHQRHQFDLSRRISSTLTNLLDLPAPGAPPPDPQVTATHPRHEIIALPPSTERAGDPDALPVYSRRPPQRQVAGAPAASQRLHVYSSSKSKLTLSVRAPGETHIVLVQGSDPDASMWLEGELRVSLPQPDSISHIKIRMKGLVRTMVLKHHVNQGASAPVTDEVLLWEDPHTLWSESESGFLPNNECSDPTKLQGTFTFPFRLQLPARISQPRLLNGDPPTVCRLPPSFVLMAGNGRGPGALRGEWASCRYFIKVTLGRKGLLKPNERLIVPIIFLPRVAEPIGSPARMLALDQGHPAAGPDEDPQGWAGKKIRHQVKRGVFTAKKAWFEVLLLLPTPAVFSRLSSLPFAIKLVSSDPSTTTRLPVDSVSVFLLQRVYVTAQGHSARHDTIVAKGVVEAEGPSEGTPLMGDASGPDGPPVWGKRLKGSIPLTHSVGSSFRAPNLGLHFLVAVHVSVPGASNDAELAIPVEIVSSTRSSLPNRPANAAAPPASNHEELGLPPSYFDVVDRD